MMYPVKIVVKLVKVSSSLYMNPMQIIGLRPVMALDGTRTCVMTANDVCIPSDWPVDKIVAALKKGQK